ncbi:NAD(P)/FAD-dependent oxidoreductase [Mycobacterium heckeshornense]|uniref:Monooxygenase n=1 Tax=Mycobacterium heckeshornense TaxID=110505 RepID=A0A2G8B3N1_9MYCO|nr:NAD(P)/FAD-dependent oxidoreductase [Mycobacterium heckeshornense]KMV22680.1 monooxygenase [Mycobacterium heckeshornense]MCV7034260.1 NAD(P)/FAD-dependent oxidoreductase [Mycobacterium heckeshornense]PIJ32354.1 NAD(P)/FAD-dependent oxidoreductase [Mycobacterium heckeshornense]BCO38333.1 monooxygenase [Mycobacterium heckeshornense]BCQ11183.1 monooxygenase [Mycobacterium heckeshornense]
MTTPDCEQPTNTPDDIDIDALREKYRQEREKRLRPEGSKQYLELTGELAKFYEIDPYTAPLVRDPIREDIYVAVLGGGIAGLLAGAYLKKAGVEDVHIIEMGGDFGGVWYWNRFPGIQCDNDSYCYMPLLEELDYIPTKKYADGAEIREHCQRIGKHFGLYDSAIFSTEVRALRWDEAIKRWRISTDRGDDIRARFVVMTNGSFNRPKLPGIPGIEDFNGHQFHSSRWDYEYTGGDSTGGLHKLADKRVALIGTGASGIQIVPFLGRHAKHLYVFQRTPSSVDSRGNTPTDPEWVKTLKPGWQKERQRNFHRWSPFEGVVFDQPDLVCDFWTELGRNMTARIAAMKDPASLTMEQIMAIREEEDYKVMERLRRRIDSIVEDKRTAEALKPYYRFLCKRPCSNDEYLDTFNRPNVTLVDVAESKGVERITEKAVVAGGVEYEVDCIIYASGFEITTEISRRYAIDTIEGRNGLSLFDYWRDGYKTLHGMTARGFPNQFHTGFIQGGVAANTTAMLEQQAEHIAYIIAEAHKRGVVTVEPSQRAQDEWVRVIRETAVDTSAFDQTCTPGYYNNEGGGGGEGIRTHLGEPYGPGFYAFGELLDQWRAKGDLDGLELGT